MKKKIYFVTAFMGIAALSFGQTQRMVLAEEFTQASCGPCAAQNPQFNSLLQSNPTKVLSIKYQTNWPGVDPMNTQTQTDVGPRVSYYSCTGVPYAPMDGSVTNVSSPNYAGAPANWTQNILNTEYALSAPFSLTVTHTMSPNFDSAHVTVTITAAQNFTANGALKLRLAMIEEHIHFSAPPGTNGEMDFYNVMRKMYPNATGTALASSWTNAQTQTLTFDVAVPNFIYDKNQISFVAFIQDDGNQAVQQAAKSNPVLVTNDAAATAVSGLPSLTCSSTINPVATIKNTGSATLTSCTINYKIDNNTPMTQSWSGSLASGATTNVTLPAQTVSGSGSHTFSAWPTMPNGSPDINSNYDMSVGSFMIVGTASAAPLIEGFTASTFPPTGWGTINDDNDAVVWARVTGTGGFQASTACSKMDFYDSPSGNIDEMIAQNVDMTASSNKTLTFDVAYCQYSSENDELDVLVSSDCGATWNTVYSKAGANLKTKAAQTAAFTPNSASQWREETVDLTAYGSVTNLIIKFVATSNYGNNLYVDDINIGTTGINDPSFASSVDIYPNPMNQSSSLVLNLAKDENVTVDLYTMSGQLVRSTDQGNLAVGQHTINIDGADLAEGMYFVTIRTNDGIVTRKITVSH